MNSVQVTNNAIEYLVDMCGLDKEEAEEHLITAISMCRISTTEAPKIQCIWTQEDDEGQNLWETSCGDSFLLESDTPTVNNIKFCCFCGHPIVEKLYEPEPEDE